MHAVRLATALVIASACGGAGETGSTQHELGPELALTRRLVEPDTTVATSWLGMPGRIVYDDRTGNIFVADRHNVTVHEMTRNGVPVRSFGRKGEGPGEYSYPHDLVVVGERLLILAAHKLVAFSTSTGELLFETRLTPPAYEFASLSDTHIVTVPPATGALFNVVSLETGIAEPRGHSGDQSPCAVMCFVAALDAGRVALANALAFDITVADTAGTVIRTIPINRIPFVAEWMQEEEDLLESRMKQGEPLYHKTWVTDMRAISDHELVLGVGPPESRVGWYEYWMLDTHTDRLQRMGYDTRLFGWSSAEVPGGVVSIEVLSGAIAEFEARDAL